MSRRLRRQVRDLRSGRAWTDHAAGLASSPGPAPATAYPTLMAHLATLRAALAADRFGNRPAAEMRRDRVDLERSLARAVTTSFAADACGAPTPDGVTTWAGEGLARSLERELALLAAADDAGPA